MNKREFLATAALAASALPASALAHPVVANGPTLLTVTGAIGRSNRGPLDPVFDQLMKKQELKFEKAWAFDYAALQAMKAVTIKPTLEYDGKPHVLRGPLLMDVLKLAGATLTEKTKVLLRAIDGYAIQLPLADIQKYDFIIATHLDDTPMPLGGLGPLWALYDADRFPDMAKRPLPERFAICPWGLYHIEVQ